MPLAVDREQVLAFRRRAMHLAERLPCGSVVTAAGGGLQDSAPRAALVSLAARLDGTEPDDWRHPDLVQIWGPRGAVYVVPAGDFGVFTVGRLPRDPEHRAALAAIVDNPRSKRAELRWASPTGRIRIEWDARNTVAQLVDPPPEADDPEPARRELARRFLAWLGPATAKGFASWAGVDPSDAEQTWAALDGAGELVTAEVDGRRRQLLAADEPAVAGPSMGRRDEPVRWLPQGDPYLYAGDRYLLLPDAGLRGELYPKSVWPGALLAGGELVGTWRRQQGRMTVTPWFPLDDATVAEAESEAAALPLPVDRATIAVEWRS